VHVFLEADKYHNAEQAELSINNSKKRIKRRGNIPYISFPCHSLRTFFFTCLNKPNKPTRQECVENNKPLTGRLNCIFLSFKIWAGRLKRTFYMYTKRREWRDKMKAVAATIIRYTINSSTKLWNDESSKVKKVKYITLFVCALYSVWVCECRMCVCVQKWALFSMGFAFIGISW
jgi:hypothetical protein